MSKGSKASFWLILAAMILGSALGYGAFRLYPRTMDTDLPPCLPTADYQNGRLVVHAPADVLLAEVAQFEDELEAYLYFEYLQSHARIDPLRVLLTCDEAAGKAAYQIYFHLPNDLLTVYPWLNALEADGYIDFFRLEPSSYDTLAYKRMQTAVFAGTYQPQSGNGLDRFSTAQLLPPVARFLVFKSATDGRVRRKNPTVPAPLSFAQAQHLAADIIEVARFYSLPLDQFLGIGAMENNYLTVTGDLTHSVWKRRAEPGDIVLARARGRVRVLNYSIGIWQITRETLRFAHELYLQDKRDYSQLPPRLRPAKTLDFNTLNMEVLTTYAGLLFRHNLDNSAGNVLTAVGAYNSSLRHPNRNYAEGVEAVASYARHFLEGAATWAGKPAAADWLLGGEARGNSTTPCDSALDAACAEASSVHPTSPRE